MRLNSIFILLALALSTMFAQSAQALCYTYKGKLYCFPHNKEAAVVPIELDSSESVDAKTFETVESYRQRQVDATPRGVLTWLKAGNLRFVTGRGNHGGYPTDARRRAQISAQGQRPLAAVLSCIDSRTVPELVFDTSVGDLFTARVGANVTNEDLLGSLEIATESGAKVIVVLGHTDCGGVKAACSGLELGHFTQLLERVKPAIASANTRLDSDPVLSKIVGERVVSNRRYIAEVSHENAVMSANQLRKNSSILREKIERGDILLVSALFDVDSGQVMFDTIK